MMRALGDPSAVCAVMAREIAQYGEDAKSQRG
jgi:hypothetical protein